MIKMEILNTFMERYQSFVFDQKVERAVELVKYARDGREATKTVLQGGEAFGEYSEGSRRQRREQRTMYEIGLKSQDKNGECKVVEFRWDGDRHLTVELAD